MRSARYAATTQARCRQMQGEFEYNMMLASLELVRRQAYKCARSNIRKHFPKSKRRLSVKTMYLVGVTAPPGDTRGVVTESPGLGKAMQSLKIDA